MTVQINVAKLTTVVGTSVFAETLMGNLSKESGFELRVR